MFFYATGFQPIWWLTWLAPLPVLIIAPYRTERSAFLMAALAWFLGGLNTWYFYLYFVQIPLPLMLLFSTFTVVIFGFAVALFRHYLHKGAVIKAAFSYPTLWVSYEFLNSQIWAQDTYGNLGYTQLNNLPVLQVVSVTGIWGISFLLFLLPASLAALISSEKGTRQWQSLTAIVAVIFGVILMHGFWRLYATPSGPTVKVGLAAIGIEHQYSVDIIKGKKTESSLIREFLNQIKQLSAQGAQIIVLPEKIAKVPDEKIDQFDSLFKIAVTTTRADIVVGIDHISKTTRYNEARLYTANSTSVGVYNKHHLVPHYEDGYQIGTSLLVANGSAGLYGIEICKDMDFPPLSRQYGKAGTALLFVPAWDAITDGWLHSRMAIMRGVESGFTIIRSANQGRLTVSDDRGRIFAEQNSERTSLNTLIAEAPIRHTDTIYARWGNWFGWLNVAAFTGILLTRRKPARKRNHEGHQEHEV